MTDIGTVLTLIFSLIVTVATIIIARATNKYVELNASLVEETKLLRKAQTDPRISVYLRQRDSINLIMDLVVRNDSQAQARDLKFQVSPDIYYFKDRKFSDIAFFRYLPSLQPGEYRSQPMLTRYWKSVENAGSPIPESITIGVTYQDVVGNKKEEKFPIPLRSYMDGEYWTEDTALDKIAKSLEKIEQTTKKSLEYIQETTSEPKS